MEAVSRFVAFSREEARILRSYYPWLGGKSMPWKTVWWALRRTAIYASPLIVWLIIYESYSMVPASWRPPVDVETLARAEDFLFFGFPHRELSSHVSMLKDILAGTIYIIHFGAPVFVLIWLAFFGGDLFFRFMWCLGWANMFGVITQMMFPTAPPWYFDMYGYQPARYDMVGDAAGLDRLDELLGFPLYESIYGQSLIVFGSFPSLHCALPALVTMFSYRVIGSFWPGVVWTLWLGWAASYLRHHFVLDLIGGVVYAFLGYYSINWKKTVVLEKSRVAQRQANELENEIEMEDLSQRDATMTEENV